MAKEALQEGQNDSQHRDREQDSSVARDGVAPGRRQRSGDGGIAGQSDQVPAPGKRSLTQGLEGPGQDQGQNQSVPGQEGQQGQGGDGPGSEGGELQSGGNNAATGGGEQGGQQQSGGGTHQQGAVTGIEGNRSSGPGLSSGGHGNSVELQQAAAAMQVAATTFTATTTSAAAAQITRVRAEGETQKGAVRAALATLRSEITASFASLRTKITADGQAARDQLGADRDSEKEFIDTQAQEQIARIRDGVPAKKQELLDLGDQLGVDATAHGRTEAERAATQTLTISRDAVAIGEQKGSSYADYDEAKEIAITAREMAGGAARGMVDNGAEIAQTALSDGRALATKLRQDAIDYSANLEVDADAISNIEAAATKAKSDIDDSHNEIVLRLEEVVTNSLDTTTGGEATALAEINGMEAPMIEGIGTAVESAVAAIETGEAQAIAEMEASVNQVFDSLANVHESRAAEGVAVMNSLTGQLEAAPLSVISGMEQLGDGAVSGVSGAGQASVDTLMSSGSGIVDQNLRTGDEIATQLTDINTAARDTFGQMSNDSVGKMKEVADAVMEKVEEAFMEGRDSLGHTYNDGAAEITKKVDDCIAEMSSTLSDLGRRIDDKADEIENASWWESALRAIGGFLSGFFGGLWDFVTGILLVLAIVLVVLIILIVVIVVLVAIFPALLGPLLAGAAFLIAHGALILTVIGYIGLAVGIGFFAFAVYKAWKVWQDPSTTWTQKWEAIGRATFELVDVIGPGKFVKWTKGLRGGAGALDDLHDASRLDDAGDVGRLDDAGDLARLDDAGDAAAHADEISGAGRLDEVLAGGGDASRVDDVAGAGGDVSRVDDVVDAGGDVARTDDAAGIGTAAGRTEDVVDAGSDAARTDDAGDLSRADDATTGTGDPLRMSGEDLAGDPELGRRLFAMAEDALNDVGPRLKAIGGDIRGAEVAVGLKRSDPAEFIAQVLEKVSRKNYTSIGQMSDMARARISLESGDDIADVVRRIEAEFPGARVDWKADLDYPRVHIELDAANGIRFELQVGTFATTRFLETADVVLPDEFIRAMGRSDSAIDFHDVMYKGLVKFQDPEIRARYGLDELETRYNQGMRDTGSGRLDTDAYNALRDDIQNAINRIASEEPDAVRRAFGLDEAGGAGRAADELGETGTVWDGIRPTQGVWEGTEVPRSFELSTVNGDVWVHGNGSKHIAERATGQLNRGVSLEMVRLQTQQQMRSLRAAIEEALRGGEVPYDELLNIGGWELKFGAPREAGQLPVLFHALMNP